MYHLGEDFAGGMLLWAVGALTAAALTGSRGALAVALTAASIWSDMRLYEAHDTAHFPFVVLWLIAGGLALAWTSRVAAHLVAVAAISWFIAAGILRYDSEFDQLFVLNAGAALLLGGGLALAATPWRSTRLFGAVLSIYGAFGLAGATVLEVATSTSTGFHPGIAGEPLWASACGVAGAILAFAAAATTRQAGTALAGAAIGLALVAVTAWTQPGEREPWLAYAIELGAMLCLVVSGMLDDVRPRIVAGWLGIAGVIAGITWAVRGSLLRRSAFLAAAGAVATALATILNRLLPRTDP
jgi:hypothetical protein